MNIKRTYLIILVLCIYLIQFNVYADDKKIKGKDTSTIGLEDIWKSNVFSSKSVSGIRSMQDGLHYTTHEHGDTSSYIVRYEYETGNLVDTLLNSNWLVDPKSQKQIVIDDYHFSQDENKIMIASGTESIYRHSTREQNYIWDRKLKRLSMLTNGGKQRYATFSPAGNKVAFVRGNNLYVKDIEENIEIQCTKDGKNNEIINGATDWVYEEEFGFDKAFFWSSDGAKIAYYRFDESGVKEFTMAKYGSLYPYDYKFKYPKAGESNATVSIHVFDLDSQSSKKIDIGDSFEYVPRIKWTKDPSILSIQRMNRHQNRLDLLLGDVELGSSKLILTEERDTYVDITDDLTFLKNGNQFIWSSDQNGFNHLYLYSLSGTLLNQITSGNWDVMSYIGYNEIEDKVYFIGAVDQVDLQLKVSKEKKAVYADPNKNKMQFVSSPLERHLFSIDLNGENNAKLSIIKGTNSAHFSKGFTYYINYHTSATTPKFVSLHRSSGEQIRILENNSRLKENLLSFNLSKTEFFNFTTSEGVKLNGWMIKPPDFDNSKQYPLLMYVYGGPGAQTVNDSWGNKNAFWYQMLAQQGYIVVSVDNRGTGARGADFKKCTYKELGKLETIDQIEAAKYLGNFSYIDSERIGIWGWSYGGYMTSLCMTKGADVFKLGIAVAPVTNWRYYDSIYTERYMQTPQENASGYDNNSPINHVGKLEGKYLLVHGSADDNVHYQNTMEMISALVGANKQFDLFIYPDKNHGIYGGNTRLHLFTKMTDFILNNL